MPPTPYPSLTAQELGEQEAQDSEQRIRGRSLVELVHNPRVRIPWTQADQRLMLRALAYYQLTPWTITTALSPPLPGVQRPGRVETVFNRICKDLRAYYPHNNQYTAAVHPRVAAKLRALLAALARARVVVVYKLPVRFCAAAPFVYWPAHTRATWSDEGWDGEWRAAEKVSPAMVAVLEGLAVSGRNVPRVVREAAEGMQLIPYWDEDKDGHREVEGEDEDEDVDVGVGEDVSVDETEDMDEDEVQAQQDEVHGIVIDDENGQRQTPHFHLHHAHQVYPQQQAHASSTIVSSPSSAVPRAMKATAAPPQVIPMPAYLPIPHHPPLTLNDAVMINRQKVQSWAGMTAGATPSSTYISRLPPGPAPYHRHHHHHHQHSQQRNYPTARSPSSTAWTSTSSLPLSPSDSVSQHGEYGQGFWPHRRHGGTTATSRLSHGQRRRRNKQLRKTERAGHELNN